MLVIVVFVVLVPFDRHDADAARFDGIQQILEKE
jgi:hypothetical protein